LSQTTKVDLYAPFNKKAQRLQLLKKTEVSPLAKLLIGRSFYNLTELENIGELIKST
ncbi:unnamed protein product, partial [marine sediment metagenome]